MSMKKAEKERLIMKRYNFDTVPPRAMGYSVHANSMAEALIKATALEELSCQGKTLVFRDNEKCIKSKYYKCEHCWPKKKRIEK